MQEKRFAAQRLIEVSNELGSQISMNDKMIEERRMVAAATSNLSADILRIVLTIRDSLNDKSQNVEERMQKSLDVLGSVINVLESYPTNQHEEIIKLEATQEGIRRTLEAIKTIGENEIRELESPALPPVKSDNVAETVKTDDDIDWDDDT